MVKRVNYHNGVVLLDYNDLTEKTTELMDSIAAAFGNNQDCLGICLVKNVPGLLTLRERVLTSATTLANLPAKELDGMVDPVSTYMFGWSHGKEIMNGKPDFAKGSFYNNPTHDCPPDVTSEKQDQFPAYYHSNIWPPSMPSLKLDFMALGSLIIDVGKLVASQCDMYLNSVYPELPPNFIATMINESVIHKARLLHYFPTNATQTTNDINDWCGLHLDHSALTGLTSALYVGDQTDANVEQSGLYIKTRDEKFTKVSFPPDYLAFQIGEAAQIASRGLLVATPHLVKGVSSKNIARNTFAVFMQPNVDFELTPNYDFAKFTSDTLKSHH